jgi:DNA N-6-adenine-methyltransferase (Dam)
MSFVRNHKLESSDEHYNPKVLFDALNLTFGTDVCAPEGGVPWIPAINYYSKERDGLSNDWFGLVWMNPPFSKPAPWVDRFIEHNNGIALCVVSKSIWFNKLWNAADGIVPFPRSWKFERPDGSKKTISFQSFLFSLGKEATQALNQIPDYKVR